MRDDFRVYRGLSSVTYYVINKIYESVYDVCELLINFYQSRAALPKCHLQK